MKAIRKFKFSIASVLLLTAITGFLISDVIRRHTQVTAETKVFETLRESGIEMAETRSPPNIAERILGIQLQPSEFKASLRYDQNSHLYELTKLNDLKELTIVLNGNLPNLMTFSDFKNLEKLSVEEWYSPETLDGVQSLPKLKYLRIGDAEVPDKIDLTALVDHPSLEKFLIDSWPLDKSNQFQVLPDW